MRKGIYVRLAADNIRKNAQTYVPYILTCILTTAMLYIICSLSLNEGLEHMSGSAALQSILSLGVWVTRIFGFVFLFYTNSFLIKRRRKEFGLFNILGMEKRHLAKMLLLETAYTAVISLVVGLCGGILLDKLLFLTLVKMIGGNVQLGFYVSEQSVITTSIFMLATFLMILLNSLRQIHLSSPIELLHGGETGEKEPKTKWIMAVLGVLLLGVGYYISFTTKSPLKALALFFLAIICVIVGTYLLFVAGSIAWLKILKKNKRYYYQTSHFTSVSGLIYRMKQNAVGLANICILSTMVLVMVSTTSSFMVGAEDIIHTRYPHEIEISSPDKAMVEDVDQFLEAEDVETKNQVHYSCLSFSAVREQERFYIPDDVESAQTFDYDIDTLYEVILLTQEEYSRLTGTSAALADGEVLLYTNDKRAQYDTLNVLDMELHVQRLLDDFPVAPTGTISSICLIVEDEAVMNVLNERQAEKYGKSASIITTRYEFDLTEGDIETVYHTLRNWLSEHVEYDYRLSGSYEARESFTSLYGGLFFLGIFLGALFLMETILIIYYKQISEGFDDQRRFAIMQNVGMSRAEVKRTIHSQIVIVFFLPLFMAFLHVLAAFPLISRLLVLMNMTNTKLYLLCTLACFVVFAVVYAAVYLMTAKVYYRIVSR